MDFRNFCQKIDVENLRAKIPPLPNIPNVPPLKLPKLKSRKIFKSSRENVNDRSLSPKPHLPPLSPMPPLGAPSIPPAHFIDRSPRRISTISSLVCQHRSTADSSTYRSADSIDDDDYPTPLRELRRMHTQPISPVRTPSIVAITTMSGGSGQNVQMTFTQKLQKGVKDIGEFRLKHIFAKKTVVRSDKIEVDYYVRRYNEDREVDRREEDKRERAIAGGQYGFRFRESREDSQESGGSKVSAREERKRRSDGDRAATKNSISDDESGMEASPPTRRPGIAATRFARVRNPPRSMSQENNDTTPESAEEDVPAVRHRPIPSALWSTKINRTPMMDSPAASKQRGMAKADAEKSSGKAKAPQGGYGARMRQRLTGYLSSHDEDGGGESGAETAGGVRARALNKLRALDPRRKEDDDWGHSPKHRKRRAPLSPQESEENQEGGGAKSAMEKPLNAIKENIKRFHKSMKRHTPSSGDAGDGASGTLKTELSAADRIAARFAILMPRGDSLDQVDYDTPKRGDALNRSPLHVVLANKLQNFKKSFKKKITTEKTSTSESNEEGAASASSPTKHKRSDTLMKKLKYIRSRKSPHSMDNLDADDEDDAAISNATKPERKSTNFEEKFQQARKQTFKKVNATMQQMKFFRKSQDQTDTTTDGGEQPSLKTPDSSPEQRPTTEAATTTASPMANLQPAIIRRKLSQQENEEEIGQGQHKSRSASPYHAEELTAVQQCATLQKAHASWTSKPIRSESLDSEDADIEFPRVLIHQDNSDAFDATLIIAVTRPALTVSMPVSPALEITEIPNEMSMVKPKRSVTPLQEPERLSAAPTALDQAAKLSPNSLVSSSDRSKLSAESLNSDSDSWIPLTRASPNNATFRRASTAALISDDDKDGAWKISSPMQRCEDKLHKAKSIDIFEKNTTEGGALAAFDDFDDELKNQPVVKIGDTRHADSLESINTEDSEAADDDNSSRVTKILANVESKPITDVANSGNTKATTAPEEKSDEPKRPPALQQIGNSRESLIANFDENEEYDESEEDDDDDDSDDGERPPSKPPSPPPPSVELQPPTPPPIPQRLPSTPIETRTTPPTPPMPQMKPPLPPPCKAPPRIPDRSQSMIRPAKPLVKTSSLRLAYSEQVKPADVGKVNKLISRFETPQTSTAKIITQRPRIIRRVVRAESEEYSDDEEEDSLDVAVSSQSIEERNETPTPTNSPTKSSIAIEENAIANRAMQIEQSEHQKLITEQSQKNEKNIKVDIRRTQSSREVSLTAVREMDVNANTKTSRSGYTSPSHPDIDGNFNFSLPNSEYGSPLEYPSSLRGSAESTPMAERRRHETLRSRRSRARSLARDDDDEFQSFESDEEHSYYSISSTGSNRYVVEI